MPSVETVLAVIPPAWVLAVLLALLNVFVFHAVLGHAAHTALYFMPPGILGFAAGNFLAWAIRSPLPMLGDVHVIEATVGAWIVLSLTNARRR